MSLSVMVVEICSKLSRAACLVSERMYMLHISLHIWGESALLSSSELRIPNNSSREDINLPCMYL